MPAPCEVMQALLMADCFPAGMELFPASDEQRWELIQRVIDESDYYIVIIGGRYGSTDDLGISFTEREYDYAVSIGLPILGFMHGDPGEIPAKKTELSPEAQTKLNELRSKVGSRMCKYFTGPDDLGGKVALSIMAARKQTPAVGWVRGSEALTDETREELLTLRARVAELELDGSRNVDSGWPTGDLESGDDTVEVSFTAALRHKMGTSSPTDRLLRQLAEDDTRVAGSVTLTWNQVISSVGPLLLDEDTEARLFGAVRTTARRTWLRDGDVNGLYPQDHKDETGESYNEVSQFSLTTEAENRVLVQLRALHLIEHGSKKRSLADTGKYWRLSPEGERQVLVLLATTRATE